MPHTTTPSDAYDPSLLEVRHLTKRFLGTTVLDAVDFSVRRGEIHALLGENGAGKSTLIKILAGIHRSDGGEVVMEGERVDPQTSDLPIAFIHQDLGLVDDMTVAENVALGTGYARTAGLISWRAVRRRADEALATMGHGIQPDALAGGLSAAERAIVAIGRALAEQAKVLVLDEPTAPLPEADVNRLFEVLERVRASGMGLIYVTHRLDEVFRAADRVTVLRNGRRVGSYDPAGLEPAELVRLIVGRDVEEVFARAPAPRDSVVAELRELVVGSTGPVTLSARSGEMVGLVGLRGAGHHLVGRALAGDAAVDGGEVLVAGSVSRAHTPSRAVARGIGLVPSRRLEEALMASQSGLMPTLTVEENLCPRPTFDRRRWKASLSRDDRARHACTLIDRFAVTPAELDRPVTTLSGGNQQKVVLARVTEVGWRLMLLEEPTLGVDVGAKAEIYGQLRALLADGRAVLLISSDFEEVARLCHRAFVFDRGRVVAEVDQQDLSIERLIALSSGVEAA